MNSLINQLNNQFIHFISIIHYILTDIITHRGMRTREAPQTWACKRIQRKPPLHKYTPQAQRRRPNCGMQAVMESDVPRRGAQKRVARRPPEKVAPVASQNGRCLS